MKAKKRTEEIMERFRKLSPEEQRRVIEKLKARSNSPKSVEFEMDCDGSQIIKE